jgi:hypothetical protein
MLSQYFGAANEEHHHEGVQLSVLYTKGVNSITAWQDKLNV